MMKRAAIEVCMLRELTIQENEERLIQIVREYGILNTWIIGNEIGVQKPTFFQLRKEVEKIRHILKSSK